MEHAKAVFALIGDNPEIENAKKLLNRIVDNKIVRFNHRDMWQRMRGTFKAESDYVKALKILADRDYIASVVPVYAGKGRKPKPIYYVNPYVFVDGTATDSPNAYTQNTQNAQNDENDENPLSEPNLEGSSDLLKTEDNSLKIGNDIIPAEMSYGSEHTNPNPSSLEEPTGANQDPWEALMRLGNNSESVK